MIFFSPLFAWTFPPQRAGFFFVRVDSYGACSKSLLPFSLYLQPFVVAEALVATSDDTLSGL